ncbi:protein DpdE [Hyalangium gracile]|uniref:protein DpdE n=1 Tax=Hyalangium gracile TaxID=394092 RepID=UPI001CCAAD81|nr:protein DpdE [Hyalangium gracile]
MPALELGAIVVARTRSEGPGKAAEVNEETVTIEYFVDASESARERQIVPRGDVSLHRLSPQTRCYFRLDEDEPWQIGRIQRLVDGEYEVDLPNAESRYVPEGQIFVRCNKPILDPIEILKMKAHETPFFHDRRHAFFRSLTDQRAAARGMTGLLSASIALVPHQVEVVRRVLEDPVQRYLLADEVGLGKTIEAGVIVRQFLLDDPRGSVRLFVPPMLVPQWKAELLEKFEAFELGDVEVLGTDELEELRDAPIPGLVVLDEAHHIAALAFSDQASERARFESFRRLAHGAGRLLLLSATPALHNERSFLAMLHLLDPRLYRLEDEERFRARVVKRQQVGQLLLSLREGVHPFVIRQNLKTLRVTFAGDEKLEALASALEKTLDQPERALRDAAIRALRVHVSETYRLYRRMLRNRRRAVGEGLRALRYVEAASSAHRPLIEESDSDERWGEILELLENWRSLAHTNLVEDPAQEPSLVRLFCLLWESAGTCFEVLGEVVRSRIDRKPHPQLKHDFTTEDFALLCRHPLMEGEEEILSAMIEVSQRESEEGDRCDELLAIIRKLRRKVDEPAPKVLVFTAYTRACQIIVERLREALGEEEVACHKLGLAPDKVEEEVKRFLEVDSDCDVLVCDRTGEEGRNLQMADVVIHFDLPLSPNRIEQRIGRVDRIGRSQPMRSRVFVGPDVETSSHSAWFSMLDTGFGVFRQSIAALQFFVEERMPVIRKALFHQGAQGLSELIPDITAKIDQEHARLAEQDALDAIEALSRDTTGTFVQSFKAFDAQSMPIEQAMDGWVVDALQFARSAHPDFANVHQYEATRRTLIPTDYLAEHILPLFEQHGVRRATAYGTHHRATAVEIPGTGLFRLGDRFVDSVARYMRWDDRGQCFALWRYQPGWAPSSQEDRFFFRFNYLVEADLGPALEVGARWKLFDAGALRRWADSLYPPFVETIFMDDTSEVRKPEWLSLLERPYLSHDKGGNDWNLAKIHLRDIDQVVDPSEWPHLCQRMRESSEVHLRMRDSYIQRAEQVERRAEAEMAARLEQLRLRLYREQQDEPDRKEALGQELEVEETISQALMSGIRSPSIRLDSVGFIVLSGRRLQDG